MTNQFFSDFFNGLSPFLVNFLVALLTFLFFILLGRLLGYVVAKALEKSKTPKTYHPFFINIIKWGFIFAGFLIALNTMGFKGIAASILASGGVTALILGFAFRDLGENILSGFFLAFSRPFKIGDLIKSEDLEGTVKGVELRHTHIRTADGCDIFIPSSQIVNKPLHNYTRDGLRRLSFTIGLDYNDDIQKAMSLIKEVLSKNNDILNLPSTLVSIAGFGPNYVELQAFFWINMNNKTDTLVAIKNQCMEATRIALINNNFTFSSSVTTSLDVPPLSIDIKK